MRRPLIFFFLAGVVLLRLFLPVQAWADYTPNAGCTQKVTDSAGNPVIDPTTGQQYSDVPSLACLGQVVINVINVAFAFLGGVTVIFLLFGAVRFVVSGGDPKAIEGAKKMMTYAVVGAVVVLSSVVIINGIASALGFGNILSSFSLYKP